MSDSFFVTTPFKDIMKKNDEKCAKKVVHINILLLVVKNHLHLAPNILLHPSFRSNSVLLQIYPD